MPPELWPIRYLHSEIQLNPDWLKVRLLTEDTESPLLSSFTSDTSTVFGGYPWSFSETGDFQPVEFGAWTFSDDGDLLLGKFLDFRRFCTFDLGPNGRLSSLTPSDITQQIIIAAPWGMKPEKELRQILR